jgi:hypothetical protein
MRYLLSLLLIFSIGFAQKTVVVKKQVDDEKKIEVKVNVKDDKVLYTITEDGKTEEYEADLDDEDALAKIHEKLEAHGLDENVKMNIHEKVRSHDCEKTKAHQAECKKAKEECDHEKLVWKIKGEDGDKKIKIIKKYKMDDEMSFENEKAGFLGVQIQDLSDQLSTHFKVKDGNGVLVSEVVEDSPAEKAGIKAGDIITKVDDEDIEDASDLTTIIRSYEPESKVSVSVIRDGKKKKLSAKLGESENAFMYKFGDLGKMGEKHKMLLKMHPEELEDFKFHSFPFDQDELKEQMEELREELKEMKEQLKKIQENK